MSVTTRAAASALLILLSSAAAFAQTAASSVTIPALGSSFPAELVSNLPIGDSVYAILETTQSEVIADRFNNGGLNVGGDSRVGGFLGSWSQTLFRVGDVDITDPSGSGAALFVPDAAMWQRINIVTGLMPTDMNTPGLAVSLDPRRGGTKWERTITGSGSGGGMAASAPVNQPIPIARLKNFTFGSASASGPLSDRAAIATGITLARGSSYSSEQLADNSSTSATGFAHVFFTPSTDREIRGLAIVQRTSTPFADWHAFQSPDASTNSTAVHFQATLDQHPADSMQWRAYAGVTERFRRNDVPSTSVLIDRVVDGPVPQAVDSAANTNAGRLSLGVHLTPHLAAGSRHHIDYALDLASASTRTSDAFSGVVRELVNGTPARIWTYATPGGTSSRRSSTIAASAGDVIALSPKMTLDASLRFDFAHGSAVGAANSVNWASVLPRAHLRYGLGEHRALIFGYARSANALTHNWLAYGDPVASTATVAATAAPNIIVSRVGPGTGGNASFSGIDSDLKRPVTDEFVVGFEKRRGESTRYTLTGIIRRESNLLGVAPTWTTSPYTPISISDAGQDRDNPSDDRALLGYNRLQASFGQDGYLVTNPTQKAARAFALRMSWEHSDDRLFMLFGATASAAQGPVSNRGFGPLENDQDQPGETFTNPNAGSYTYGRLFSDRAFTIKWTTMYHFPGDFTVGGIARYQDGQPFSRLVIFQNLNQGDEVVQAYPNGGSRFTFTGTFDLRVQKAFTVGARRFEAILDAYNLFTRANEVEEFVFSGPAFRTPTAIQPPHSVHLGLRVTF